MTGEYRLRTDQGDLYAKIWSPGAAGRHAPIVLLHDSLGCVELWRDFPLRLAERTKRRVIAYDRLGFGRSDPHPARLGRDFIRDEAQVGFPAVLAQLGLDEFIVFGHSVGGGMAVACAAAQARRCRALVTESAQAFVEDRTTRGIRAAQQSFASSDQRDRLRKYHGDKAAWVLSAWIDTWLAPDFAGWTLDADLRRLRCPTLALHGDQDEYGSARHPQRIAEHAGGGATVHLFSGCGHVPHRELADVVLGRVSGWLADVVI